ncbi:MAG: patatin-like phospholipase family protein [Alistipes sp.]
MLRKSLSFISILLLCTSICSAQTVGVVMSGGGAKGLYHIGILQALEENGIPIDYVGGTSMGSIIAAMYAAGYSPTEMREIVASGVIKEWMSGRIDPRHTAYYRQIGQPPVFVSLRLNLKHESGKKFMMPTNLISSTQIDMALMELFAPATAAAGGDFSRLMVPFLCVASDLNGHAPVTLRNGDLGEAVRSSMSIPLVFKPMKKDSMLLYDGGIYDNFPWKPLSNEFKPDFIIGCKCTAGNTPPNADNNLMNQAFMLAMHNTDYALPETQGLMIDRAVGVNMLDFDSAVAIMDLGYKDAMAKMPEILERVKTRCSVEEFAARRDAFRKKCPPLIFDDYVFDGLSPAQMSYMRDFVKIDHRHHDEQHKMDFAELKSNLYSVLADGDFSMDFPKSIYDSVSRRYSFEAKFTTKPNFKVMVGGNISSTAFNQAFIGINYRTIGSVAQSLGAYLYLGPIYTWGAIGGRTDFYIWKPLFIDYSYNFAVKNFRHGSFGNVSGINSTLQVKNSDSFFSLGVGMPITRRSLFSIRTNGGHTNYHYDSKSVFANTTDHSRFSFFGIKAEIERNTLDKALYPRSGSHLTLSGIYIAGRDKYQPNNVGDFVSRTTREWLGARFSWDKYFPIRSCRWFSLGFNIDGVVTNLPDFTTDIATLMTAPSFSPIPHAHMIFTPDFYAQRFVAGGIMPTFDILPNFFFRTSFYAMYREKRDFILNDSFHLEPGDDHRMHYIVEASFVYHTPIGPVSLALTKYDLRSWKNMYLTFNFGYAMFAPKGTFY